MSSSARKKAANATWGGGASARSCSKGEAKGKADLSVSGRHNLPERAEKPPSRATIHDLKRIDEDEDEEDEPRERPGRWGDVLRSDAVEGKPKAEGQSGEHELGGGMATGQMRAERGPGKEGDGRLATLQIGASPWRLRFGARI